MNPMASSRNAALWLRGVRGYRCIFTSRHEIIGPRTFEREAQLHEYKHVPDEKDYYPREIGRFSVVRRRHKLPAILTILNR